MPQWIERPDGHWVWDTSAPDADNSPTMIRNVREAGMSSPEPTYQSTPSAPVYETTKTTLDEPVPQPEHPVEEQLVVCPNCGTGVAASRLREHPEQWTGADRDLDALPIGGYAGDG